MQEPAAPPPARVPTLRRAFTQTTLMLLISTALGIAACGGGGSDAGGDDGGNGNGNTPGGVNPTPRATVLGVSLVRPWGLAFLPDGRMLVTQRAGTLSIVSADGSRVDANVSGVPAVVNEGQGGLLDVALDPDFGSGANWVYLSYAEAGAGATSGLAVARGRLSGNSLTDVTVIWRQAPKLSGGAHFGGRLSFRADEQLYVTAGERGVEANDGTARSDASGVQVAGNTIGKVVRMARDGSGATVASTGHRNPQGAAVRPGSNDLWLTEHGPQGGDELNRIVEGSNYGWPLRSYGCAYGASPGAGCPIGGGTHAPQFVEPASYWEPLSTAPAGLAWYTGNGFPAWRGSVFAGALAGATLWRLTLNGNEVVAREEIAAVKALNQRIRDVRQGPDGWLYLLTDEGRIIRLEG